MQKPVLRRQTHARKSLYSSVADAQGRKEIGRDLQCLSLMSIFFNLEKKKKMCKNVQLTQDLVLFSLLVWVSFNSRGEVLAKPFGCKFRLWFLTEIYY